MLLAIDTCGVLGGVALGLADDSVIPTSQNRDMGHPPLPDEPASYNRDIGDSPILFRELAGKTFSEKLIGTISEILDEAGGSPEQLSGIVVVHGPGSFTGIRIGVSAAKGFAEALRIPLIAISRLELLARQSSAAQTLAVLDAGRGEFFVGVTRRSDRSNTDQPGSESALEALMTREQLAAVAEESGLPIVACEERVLSVLQAQQPERVDAPTATDALLVGAERFRAGIFDDVASLDANYLRRSETEMLARIAEHAAIREAEASAKR